MSSELALRRKELKSIFGELCEFTGFDKLKQHHTNAGLHRALFEIAGDMGEKGRTADSVAQFALEEGGKEKPHHFVFSPFVDAPQLFLVRDADGAHIHKKTLDAHGVRKVIALAARLRKVTEGKNGAK